MDSDPFASESVLFNIRSFSVTVVCCTKFGLFCLKTVPSSRKNTLLFPPPFVLGDFWPFPPPSPSSSLSLLSFFHLSIAHFCPRRLKVPLMLPPPSSLPSHPFSPAFTSPDCFLSCCLHLRFPAHFPLRSPHGPWLSLPPSSLPLAPEQFFSLSFFVSSLSVHKCVHVHAWWCFSSP